MIEVALTEQQVPDFELTAPWRPKLAAMATMQWEGYERHPWLAPALSMTRPQACFLDGIEAQVAASRRR